MPKDAGPSAVVEKMAWICQELRVRTASPPICSGLPFLGLSMPSVEETPRACGGKGGFEVMVSTRRLLAMARDSRARFPASRLDDVDDLTPEVTLGVATATVGEYFKTIDLDT